MYLKVSCTTFFLDFLLIIVNLHKKQTEVIISVQDSISSERRGIITRMVDAIFEQIGLSALYSVSVSMLEIYEERVIDLLTPSRDNLQIREMKGTVFVS